MRTSRTRRNIVIAASAAVAILASTAGGLAQQNGNNQGQNNQGGGTHPAPAPAIGTGLPTAMIVGGVLLGATFLRRWQKQP
jgi:hypothetical protein